MNNSYTFKCNGSEKKLLINELNNTKYIKTNVPYTSISVKTDKCIINLYDSNKILIQGKGAKDWINFILEPKIFKRILIGYDSILDPDSVKPHIGVDESGKGDFFGPLIIASAYINEDLAPELENIGIRDSKSIKSDNKILELSKEISSILKNKFKLITYGSTSYNKRYLQYRNLNKILAWGHAQAIENLLEEVPNCPRALSDKFGPEYQIKNQLKERGKKIILEQKIKAESDPAVATASILARAKFVNSIKEIEKKLDVEIPKGCSENVKNKAIEIVKKHGPEILKDISKCHFKTTDQILESLGYDRSDLKLI